ncbi:synaptobrevin-domain-containing protein [Mycotypha africana]|uniref:synaptobrevin-domain-containing protein n=1 Tax=Mycotypha africana TaxID=64632 RepID=UPI00230140C1|nr:synaptobrevin-domain-containing protein [Mycotypha africana]KAI8979522.1 synaptobrevin-domain-containing protein [Mycotypha africana]
MPMTEGGITYLCMADESFGRRTPFIFLENMQSRLLSNYSQSQILDAPPYGLHSFGNMIEELLGYYNTHQETDKLKRVQGEIHQVKDVMSHNIERVLERGERIDILVDRTDNLNQQAFAFKKRSTLLKRTMWWKNTKIVMLITVTCVIIFLFITVFIYGKSSSSKE